MARGDGPIGADWRTRWKISKQTGSSLFSGEVADWDINKTSLCYWFDFYDTIFEHHERPPEKIIKSIKALDDWVEFQVSSAEKERISRLGGKNKHPASHQDVIYFE